MKWKLIGTILGVAALGAVMAGSAEGSTLERQRKAIRSYFKVEGDCQITFVGDPENARAFWVKHDKYVREMIPLAHSIGITDVRGVTSYIMLALFPECDQTKEQTLSFQAAFAALEYRVGVLAEQGQ
jgi:hypothetical protein